jgi:hypothetical protein
MLVPCRFSASGAEMPQSRSGWRALPLESATSISVDEVLFMHCDCIGKILIRDGVDELILNCSLCLHDLISIVVPE